MCRIASLFLLQRLKGSVSGDASDINNIETRAVIKFFFSCNARKLAYLGFQCLDHPSYSPDLAPSDHHLFPGLIKQLKGRHFSSDAEVIAATETWLGGQPSEFFLSGLQKLEQRAKKCIELRGEYVE